MDPKGFEPLPSAV